MSALKSILLFVVILNPIAEKSQNNILTSVIWDCHSDLLSSSAALVHEGLLLGPKAANLSARQGGKSPVSLSDSIN